MSDRDTGMLQMAGQVDRIKHTCDSFVDLEGLDIRP